MLRMHFTAADLLRTHFALSPAPIFELGLAIAALQRRDPLFEGWRRRAARQLPSSARMLFELMPPTGNGLIVFDRLSASFEDGLEAMHSVPRALVQCDLHRIYGNGRPITRWMRALCAGERDAEELLDNAVRTAHAALIEPAWPGIRQSFYQDVAGRSRTVAESGLMSALEALHPSARWRDATLEIEAEVELSVRPGGRGVTLLPSAFWTGRPLIGTHPDGSALIVYPAQQPLPLIDMLVCSAPLAELLGRTRAAVLALAATPHSTGEIAQKLGISAASASVHARMLRDAGLLVTERPGRTTRHSLTSLGARLLTT
jgi:DNA-binding transcriptional ArsR family regulator